MSTDFSHNNSTIMIDGGIKINRQNTPLDVRTVVNTKADIANIPLPFVGMEITVLQDEDNEGKMTVYKVTALNENNTIDISTGIEETTVPKNISDLNNDSKFVSEDYINTNIISMYLGNKKLVYLTQTEYNSLTEEEKNSETVVYNITDAPTGFNGILTSENGTKFKLVVSNDGTLSTEEIHEIKYGEIALNKTSLSLNEGETGTFTVSLDKAPTSEEVISISVNGSNCTVNPSSLSFTSSNYSNGQEVTVTAIHDPLSYENKTDTIILSNNNVSNKSIRVTINNIDEEESTTTTLSSISAVYAQGDTVVYPTTPIYNLKSNLVVTATYSDGSTNTVRDYTLSGILTVGTSIITVSYNDKTTTFNVIVTEKIIGDSDYYVNLDFSNNSNLSVIPNLADSNLNASLNSLSFVSWENGVVRVTTTGGVKV